MRPVFPWSMSDLKPGEEFERLEPPGPPGRPKLCLLKDVMGFSQPRNPCADFGFLMPWVETPGSV